MPKRDGRVYTQIVKNCSANELIPILSEFSDLDESVIYSDCWKAYDGLVDYGAKAHYRVKHSKNEFANGKNHINGIENFWGYAKHRLSKFKGIKKGNFLLHLKECEFRYNNSKDTKTFYHILLKMIRGLISSKTKSQLKIRLTYLEPNFNSFDICFFILPFKFISRKSIKTFLVFFKGGGYLNIVPNNKIEFNELLSFFKSKNIAIKNKLNLIYTSHKETRVG